MAQPPDDDDLRTLLTAYNSSVSFHATSLLTVALVQFSLLLIVQLVAKTLWIWVAVIAYGLILFLGSYFVSHYLMFARRIERMRPLMSEGYQRLEDRIEDETRECVANAFRPLREFLVEQNAKKKRNDLWLHLCYWVVSGLIFLAVWSAV